MRGTERGLFNTVGRMLGLVTTNCQRVRSGKYCTTCTTVYSMLLIVMTFQGEQKPFYDLTRLFDAGGWLGRRSESFIIHHMHNRQATVEWLE